MASPRATNQEELQLSYSTKLRYVNIFITLFSKILYGIKYHIFYVLCLLWNNIQFVLKITHWLKIFYNDVFNTKKEMELDSRHFAFEAQRFLLGVLFLISINVCIKHVYICVAGKNVLAAPNCKKKQLFSKPKTFLHDVYEKALFPNMISFYIKRRRTFFIENKAKLRATPCSSPFLLPFLAPPFYI